MTQRVSDWLDNERGQTFAAQRARIETSKLLATFSAALAAAVTATALQVNDPNGLDIAAVVFLLLSALGAVAVIMLDRSIEVRVETILRDAQVGGWSHARLLTELRSASYKALDFNESVVTATKTGAVFTAVMAFGAGILAALSLLQAPT